MADKTRVIRLVADAAQFKKELGELVTATKKVEKATADTAKSMSKLEGLGKGVGTALKAAAAAFSAMAAVKSIKKAADDMAELYTTSQKLGVAVETLSAYGHAASLAGVSTEALGMGFKTLSKNMVDMDTATTKSASALRALGVVSTDTGEQAFKKIADALSKMPDGGNKTALAMAALGKSGADLIPMLNEGGDGLQRMADEAARFGLVIDEQTARAADDFGDNLDRLNGAFNGAVRQITAGMLPAMITLSNEMVGLVNDGKTFKGVGEDLGELMLDISIAAMHAYRSIDTFGKTVGAAAAATALSVEGNFTHLKRFFEEYAKGGSMQAIAYAAFAMSNDGADAAAQVWKELSSDIAKDVAETEERINHLRAAFNRAKAEAASGGGGGRDPKVDGIGTGWAETGTGGGKGDTRRRSLSRWAVEALAEAERYFEELEKIRDALAAIGTNVSDLEQIAGAWEKGARAGQEMETSLARQNELIAWQKDNPQVTDADVAKMDELLRKRDELNGKIRETQDKIKEDMANAKQAADQVSGVFVDWATGIIDAESALKGFVAILLDFLAKKYVLDFLTNLMPGGEGNAKGAAFSGGVKYMARGGVLNSATMMGISGGKMQVAGEAGPEGVLPLRRDRSGNLGVIAAGRPELRVVVNNMAGVDVSTSVGADGGLTLDIVRKAISNDIARGGSTVSRAMERTYGIRR